jgi:hypothetical protein
MYIYKILNWIHLFINLLFLFSYKSCSSPFNLSRCIVTGSRYADCHCYPTAGYIATAAGVTEFPEICAVATQRKAGYEFHIRSKD